MTRQEYDEKTAAGTLTAGDVLDNPGIANARDLELIREYAALKREIEFSKTILSAKICIDDIMKRIPQAIADTRALADWSITSRNVEGLTLAEIDTLFNTLKRAAASTFDTLKKNGPVPGNQKELRGIFADFRELCEIFLKLFPDDTPDAPGEQGGGDELPGGGGPVNFR